MRKSFVLSTVFNVGISDHLQSLGVKRVVNAAKAVAESVCRVEVAVGVHFRFLSVPFLMY